MQRPRRATRPPRDRHARRHATATRRPRDGHATATQRPRDGHATAASYFAAHRVGFNGGDEFGWSPTFLRVNLASPRATLRKGLERFREGLARCE